MIIKKNAEAIVKEQLSRDNVVATRKALETNINHSYRHKFFQELQIYVTKIAIALDHCIEDINLGRNYYAGSIEFICKKIIKKDQLYKVMNALDINDAGNSVKHSNDDIDGDIDYTLKQYNQMITELVKATGIQAFKKCYLNKKKNVRDVAFVEEQRHHKYFVIRDSKIKKDIKLQLKINPSYELDPYSKKAKSKITLYWPESNKGYFVNVTITNPKNKRIVASKKQISLEKGDFKEVFFFEFKEGDLDRRVIELDVKIELLKTKENVYTTGILFWKEYHSYETIDETPISTHVEKLTQLYRPK